MKFTVKVENLFKDKSYKKYEPFIKAYDKYGQYVGDLKWLEELIRKHKIVGTVKTGKTLCVCKTKEGYIGFSQRGRVLHHFKVGDKIKYAHNLFILSNGSLLEGSKEHKQQEKDIKKVNNLFNRKGYLHIKNKKIALFLAKRFADAVNFKDGGKAR